MINQIAATFVFLFSLATWAQEMMAPVVVDSSAPTTSTTSSTSQVQEVQAIPTPSPTPQPPAPLSSQPSETPPQPVVPPSSGVTATSTEPAVLAKYKVRQILRSANLILVESDVPVDFPTGKLFIVTLADGSQCSMSLKEISGLLLAFDAKECLESAVTLTSAVEPSLVSTNAEKRLNKGLLNSGTSKGKIGLSIYYSAANTAKFDDMTVTQSGSSASGSAKFDTDAALGVGISYSRMEPQGWGFSLGGTIEGQRELKNVTLSGPGGTNTATYDQRPKLTLALIEANAIYRWDNVYLPFGLNASLPILEYSGTDRYTVKSGIGAFVGVGFFVTPNSSLELFVKSIGMAMTVESGTTAADLKTGYLSGVGFGWNYFF